MKLSSLVSLGLIFIAAGCASSGSVPTGSEANKPKPDNCTIELYAAEGDVKRPFTRVCIVSASTGSTLLSKKSPEAAVARAKKEACRCGADALVLSDMQREGISWKGWGKSAVKATAIRFTDTQ